MDLVLAGDRLVKKSDFQLVGLTCLFMACKMEEIMPPLLEELVLFGCGSFNKTDMIRMEVQIGNVRMSFSPDLYALDCDVETQTRDAEPVDEPAD